jgi:hypothetical protein
MKSGSHKSLNNVTRTCINLNIVLVQVQVKECLNGEGKTDKKAWKAKKCKW